MAHATRPLSVAAVGAPRHPSLAEATRYWLELGCASFGGPAAQISMLHAELVERRRWIGEQRFLQGLNFCLLLPGPEAQQLATYCGWLLHGWRGGVIAGTLFFLPGAIVLWALAFIYVTWGSIGGVASFFHGLQAAVLGGVAAAVLRLGQRTLRGPAHWAVALGAWAALALAGLAFPFVIFAAAVVGWALGRWQPALWVTSGGSHAPKAKTKPAPGATETPSDRPFVIADEAPPPAHCTPRPGHLWQTPLRWLCVWWVPVALVAGVAGPTSLLTSLGLFFSGAAVITFGGAYAVLPYVAEQAVETYQWVTAPQMLAGLGLAESTPGPLVLVLQFVGFLAAWQQPDGWPPLLAATVGAALTTWVTFAPSFLYIFTGAPYLEKLRTVRWLQDALVGIAAAVVGVVLNLAVWFGHQVLWPVGGSGLDGFAAAVAVAAFTALHCRLATLPVVILIAGMLGLWQGWWLGRL